MINNNICYYETTNNFDDSKTKINLHNTDLKDHLIRFSFYLNEYTTIFMEKNSNI